MDSFEILKGIKFNVNTMQADLLFMKRIFNNDRIAKMNMQDEKIKLIEYEISTIKMRIENLASRDSLHKLD